MAKFGSQELRDQIRDAYELSQMTPAQKISLFGVDHPDAEKWFREAVASG